MWTIGRARAPELSLAEREGVHLLLKEGPRKPAAMTIPAEKKPLVSDAGAWAMNILSSVGIIMANKQVMSATGYDFRYGETF